MSDDIVRFALRADKVLYKKFSYVAEYNARSINKEMIHLMKRRVAKFEEEHGEIPIEPEEE